MRATGNGYQAAGERELWCAVIWDQVRCAQGKVDGGFGSLAAIEYEIRKARAWFLEGTDMLIVATLAGVEGRRLRAWAEGQERAGWPSTNGRKASLRQAA